MGLIICTATDQPSLKWGAWQDKKLWRDIVILALEKICHAIVKHFRFIVLNTVRLHNLCIKFHFHAHFSLNISLISSDEVYMCECVFLPFDVDIKLLNKKTGRFISKRSLLALRFSFHMQIKVLYSRWYMYSTKLQLLPLPQRTCTWEAFNPAVAASRL